MTFSFLYSLFVYNQHSEMATQANFTIGLHTEKKGFKHAVSCKASGALNSYNSYYIFLKTENIFSLPSISHVAIANILRVWLSAQYIISAAWMNW